MFTALPWRTISLTALVPLAASCASRPTPVPIAMPQPSPLVQQAEASTELRSTIVGGEAPVPGTPRTATTKPRPGDIAFNFPMADVAIVAKSVLGDVLRREYVIAPGVTTQVSFVTPGRVARESVLGLFEKALRDAGLALTPVESGFLIQPVASAQAPVAPGAIGYGGEILTLQFINADELKKLLDSVLPGVVTATDPVRNAVTISGTTGQRASARDLIKQFDVNWLRNMSFALLVPQRTDSRLIVPELEKLINAPDAPTRGLVRLIQMERLNGILAISAQREYLEDVRRWIDILDREGASNEAKLFVYRVQNGRARDLVKTLNAAFGIGGGVDSVGPVDPLAAQNDLNTTQNAPRPPVGAPNVGTAGAAPREPGSTSGPPGGTVGSAASSFTGRISTDEVNNAVVVFGTPRDFAVVEDAMRKLDVPPTQVLIEAAITEVALTGDLNYGVDWNFIQGNSTVVSGAGTPALPAANTAGFAYFLRTSDISTTLRALESRTNIKVISAPKLLVLNNQTAALQVGNQVPIQTQQQQAVGTGNGNIVNSIEYRDTGVILRVTPRVNASGLVLLDISQEVSSVASLSTGGIASPTIATRRIATTVAVQDGQVLGLGGLFSDSNTSGTSGLPILSRIPILGALFGKATGLQERRELIILIKPQIVRTPEDGRAITEELRAKLRTLEPFRTQRTHSLTKVLRSLLTGFLLLGGFGSSVTAQPVQFGVNTKFDQGLTGVAMIEHILATGVTVSRDSLSWQNVEVDRGQYVWSPAYGRRYATLAQHGIRSNVILTVGNKIYDGGKFPTSPAAVAAYARFAGFVARTLRGQTVAYEIGNEWRSTPVAGGRTTFIDYARLFVAAADAIHAADPSARVVADPAIFANASATAVPAVGTPLGDTARLALRVADGVVVHQYPYQASGRSFADAQAGMVKAMTRRADWLAAMAGRPVSLYVTEFGWPQIAARGLTPDEQAMQLATTTRALAALSFVRLAVVYELADSCSQAASIECTFGLYRRQNGRFVAKPALAAFRNAVAAK